MEVEERKVQLHIGGMTCVSCQNKIQKELKRTKGILSATVSYSNGTAEIIYDKNKTSLKKIIAVIENLDYQVVQEKTVTCMDLVKMVCTSAIIILLYLLLQSLGVLNLLVPSQLADTKMGYGMLFVIGFMTSVHCIAMCGGINLSQCIPRAGVQESEKNRKLSTLYPSFFYNLGRVCSYTAVGFVLGLVGFLIGGGTEVGMSRLLQGILKIIAGLCMVIMGINMLGIFPWLRKFTIRMPGFLARKIGREKARSSRPFVVGILNGFMPCGPLQSMWIVALAAANPFAGALSMFLFSLGTVPLMLGLGFLVSALGKKFTDTVMTVGAILVVVLGLAMLSQGGALSGWLGPDLLLLLVIVFCCIGILLSIPVKKRMTKYLLRMVCFFLVAGSCILWHNLGTLFLNPAESLTEVVDGVQVINSTLEPGRYPNITVLAGVPVKWVIDAPEGSINGCNYKMMIPDYDLVHTFQTGENVLEFTPEETGTVRYSCWMGMIYGNIFVTDGTENEGDLSIGEARVPTPSGYSIPTDTIGVASLTTDQSGLQVQEVRMDLTDEGFSPAVIVLQSGVSAIWNIDNQLAGDETETDVLIPAYSTKLALKQGMNQMSLYPSESFDSSTGDHRFYCYVKVVDDLAKVDEGAVKEEVAAWNPLIYPEAVFESAGMSCCGN